MSNIINFPRCRPPFLEIVAEDIDGYTHAIVWRDKHYRPVLCWRGHSHAEAAAFVAELEADEACSR